MKNVIARDEQPDMGAFEKDTLYRQIVEAARYWVIEHQLRTGQLPEPMTYYAYSDGPRGFDWGNPPGVDDDGLERPLRRKRVTITLSIEDDPFQIPGDQ